MGQRGEREMHEVSSGVWLQEWIYKIWRKRLLVNHSSESLERDLHGGCRHALHRYSYERFKDSAVFSVSHSDIRI